MNVRQESHTKSWVRRPLLDHAQTRQANGSSTWLMQLEYFFWHTQLQQDSQQDSQSMPHANEDHLEHQPQLTEAPWQLLLVAASHAFQRAMGHSFRPKGPKVSCKSWACFQGWQTHRCVLLASMPVLGVTPGGKFTNIACSPSR